MTDIKLVDVSVRDGNQSLWGATGLDTAQMLQIAPVMNRVGFKAIDFTSSTHMAVAVRYFQEDPWERIRLMRRAMPDTRLQFITTCMRFISWEIAGPDFMRLVYRRLIANGIDRFVLLDPMHDVDALLEAAKTVREEGGSDVEIMAALTFTVSAVHDDAFYADIAKYVAESPHFDRAYIKDPAGLLSLERARTLIPAVQQALNGKPLELHSHCTIGQSQFTYPLAADLGLDVLHVAAGPLSNGTSLPSALRTVSNLREMGHTVDIDDHALARMADYFDRLAQAEGLPPGTPQEYDAAFLRHQVPGGVMTTMKRQLAELGHEDRLPEVIEEVERVRADLGYPIMVTPFPQMVCTQALFNVIAAERYENVPDQVIRYVTGRFGRPTRPVDSDVKDRILARPRAQELMAEPETPPLAERRKKFDPDMSDDEFLLRATMPEDQVDAMKAAGPAKRRYNPDSRPLTKLLKELSDKPARPSIAVEKPDFKLELRARDTGQTEKQETKKAAAHA